MMKTNQESQNNITGQIYDFFALERVGGGGGQPLPRIESPHTQIPKPFLPSSWHYSILRPISISWEYFYAESG